MSQPVAAETNEASPSLWLPGPGAGGARPSQMPASPNPLIGREGDLAAVRALLARDGVRLVTLTGPGGVGKTRLALAVAASAEEAFADGAAFVSLAPVQDAALAPAAIAAALEVQESGGRPLADDLIARLRDDRFLLVLDNFERLPDAAPLVADLLRGCPRLTVLVTSRRRLRLSGEHEIPVPPLPLADLDRPSTVEELAGVPSVRLFVERAQAAAAGFALTEANGRQIAEICRHLDGLPLAIELAAPRTRILSPAALLARLANRLQLLTDGPRDAPERLQTMRQAIAWSYDLLDPDHQTLLRHLAVFVGGFPLDAAEEVTSRRADEPARREEGRTHPPASRLAGSPTAFDLLSALVEESLVQVADGADGERRFGMLETVREYALERLVAAGEAEAARRRHAAWCLGLTGHPDWAAEFPPAQLDRLQAEHDNLRAALSWSIEHEPETALRLVGDSWRFWNERGYWSEGRGWVSRALAVCPEAPPDLRAAALAGAGALAINQGDYPEARRLLEAILPLAEQAGDESRAARTIRSLGIVASNQNDLDGAEALFAEALARLRPLGHPGVVGKCLTDLGLVAERRGDYARAITFYEEALPLGRSSGDQTFVAIVLSNLGGALLGANDWRRGEALLAEALDQSRSLGDRFGTAINLYNLADCVQRRGDLAGAWERYRESLAVVDDLGERHLASRILDRLAHLLTASGSARLAARLLAAAAALRREIGDELFPIEEEFVAGAIAEARRALGAEAFRAAWETGESLSYAPLVAETLALEAPAALSVSTDLPPAALALGLTAREIEVLRLVAAGRSDKEIAILLGISRHTASNHVTAIRTKLAAPSRTAAVTAAREAGLLG